MKSRMLPEFGSYLMSGIGSVEGGLKGVREKDSRTKVNASPGKPFAVGLRNQPYLVVEVVVHNNLGREDFKSKACQTEKVKIP